MTDQEKRIIAEAQRVFPNIEYLDKAMIRKVIHTTKEVLAGKLDECERHHITGGSDLKIYVDKTGDWISLNEAKEKIKS
jgi:hypothetical protein